MRITFLKFLSTFIASNLDIIALCYNTVLAPSNLYRTLGTYDVSAFSPCVGIPSPASRTHIFNTFIPNNMNITCIDDAEPVCYATCLGLMYTDFRIIILEIWGAGLSILLLGVAIKPFFFDNGYTRDQAGYYKALSDYRLSTKVRKLIKLFWAYFAVLVVGGIFFAFWEWNPAVWTYRVFQIIVIVITSNSLFHVEIPTSENELREDCVDFPYFTKYQVISHSLRMRCRFTAHTQLDSFRAAFERN